MRELPRPSTRRTSGPVTETRSAPCGRSSTRRLVLPRRIRTSSRALTATDPGAKSHAARHVLLRIGSCSAVPSGLRHETRTFGPGRSARLPFVPPAAPVIRPAASGDATTHASPDAAAISARADGLRLYDTVRDGPSRSGSSAARAVIVYVPGFGGSHQSHRPSGVGLCGLPSMRISRKAKSRGSSAIRPGGTMSRTVIRSVTSSCAAFPLIVSLCVWFSMMCATGGRARSGPASPAFTNSRTTLIGTSTRVRGRSRQRRRSSAATSCRWSEAAAVPAAQAHHNVRIRAATDRCATFPNKCPLGRRL